MPLISLAEIVDDKTARLLVARAPVATDWILSLGIIAKIQPSTISVISGEAFRSPML